MRNLLILFCFIPIAAVGQQNQSNKKQNDPCDTDIICSQEFRVIEVEFRDQNGNPVVFEKVYHAFGPRPFEIPKDSYESKPGFYPVASDAQMDMLSFEGDTIAFVGVIKEGDGGTYVYPMVIGKDCCHIQLISGEEKIVIER